MSTLTPASPQAGAPVPAPGPRRRALWLAAGVAGTTGALLIASAGSTLRPVPTVVVRPALFITPTDPVPVGKTPISNRTVQAPGWLEADPFTVAAAALTDGVIAEILVLEGDSVEQGQPVARLVSTDAELALSRAEADRRAAEAQTALARATLAAAETDWAEPVERTRATAAAHAALARNEAELAQLPALIAVERAMAEQLAEELDRTEQARRSGAANEIQAVVARKKLESARATVISLEQRRPILEADRALAHAELTAAERLATLRTQERLALESARAGVLRADAALAQATVSRDEAALRLERTEIRAPIAGLVQSRLKYPGSKVMASTDDPHSTHIVHLYDPAKLQARVDVPLADAAEIRVGQACEVVVEILPDRTFRGVVTRITNQADLQKNTLQIKVRLIDPPPVLKPEMLTRVKFLGSAPTTDPPTTSVAPSVLVLESSLTARDGADFVHAVRGRRADKGTLVRLPVIVLDRTDGWASVRGDLRPGDLLVVGSDTPKDAARVRITIAEDPS